MVRTPLSLRILPDYTKGEDVANMVTHIIGGTIGICVTVFAVLISCANGNVWGVVSGSIFGGSMVLLYAVSSVYHGLKNNFGKKVMQVIDHCTIYLLIAGTYTPILLSAVRKVNPVVAWTVFGVVWGLSFLGATLAAIDHTCFAKLEIILYIGIGWCIIFALKTTIAAMGYKGFMWLLSGGIAYTVGAVAYGIGSKHRYFHTIFHIFVDIGSVLQAVAVLKYAL